MVEPNTDGQHIESFGSGESHRRPVHPFFDGAPRPLPISHGGDRSAGAPDGSRAAFQLAYDRGFRWFQVDVVMIGGSGSTTAGRSRRPTHHEELASGHALLGRKRAWESLSIDEVSAQAGHEVALVSDLLDEFADVKFNLEVKSQRAERALRSLLARPGVLERTCVSSPFHRALSRRLRRDFGDRVCLAAPLLDGGLVGVPLLPFRRVRHDVCQVWLPVVRSRRLVQHVLGRGTRFQVWTVNSVRAIERCLRLGVTGIITDRHRLVRERLEAAGRWST